MSTTESTINAMAVFEVGFTNKEVRVRGFDIFQEQRIKEDKYQECPLTLMMNIVSSTLLPEPASNLKRNR